MRVFIRDAFRDRLGQPNNELNRRCTIIIRVAYNKPIAK